ncbi:OmpA family protein [Reichenbachiella carrageenanivorans]|uniref:OmpA family protein n=1 Tax=Reichenbachiella carrageenanivorans TaxID=2979869 RepID=A0ABY6CWD9_9BACT|nr:OmpA family protein [Reichenbachiella carrageenanivorans]UXX78231.1 OmpA family protein [Reichenbachiella carrageenanivorans]
MMKYLLIVIVVLCVFPNLVAQDSNKKLSKKQLIEQADYYFFKENFPKALELYKQILENYPKNHYVQYHSFVANQLSKGRGSDMSSLIEYEKNEGVTDKFYNYWLGRIHYGRYEFELAEKHFKAFLDMDVYRTNEIKKESEDLLERTKKTRAFYADLNDFEIEPLPQPINSAYDDLSPAFYANHDELLFVSARPNGIEKGQYQIFHSIKSNEQFSQPKPLPNLGIFDQNNSKIEVVNNDGRLFMYKNDNGGDLYFSEPLSSGWSNPQEFDSKLRDHLVESHFFINDDETIIYFSAKDNNGKLDLFQSTFNPANDTWSDPLPLPGLANSAYNEDAPFLSHDNKTLYFSSDRLESVGGYDVFKSEIDPVTGLWSKPENMGFPINSIDDEINFQLNEDNISGFFSSNRLHGYGDYDIYFFHKQGKVLATGKVYNQQTNEPLANALVSFHPLKYQDESFDIVTDNFGNYEREIFEEEDFIAVVSLGSQRLHSTQIRSTHDEHHKTFEKDFYVVVPEHIDLDTDFASIYKGASSSSKSYDKLEMMGSKFRSGDKAILNNIYFDLHSTTYQQESIPTLEKIAALMKDNPNLNVEIGGHTCNIGSHEANLSVSEARAESVKKYLITRGISSKRLTTKGYGETQPLASNDDEEGGRELNRRIELRVLQ